MLNKTILTIILSLIYLPTQAIVVDQIVAIVNNEVITQSELFSYQKKIQSKKGLIDDALLQFRDVNKLSKDTKYLVQHLIDEKILDSEVKKNSLQSTIEKVEQEIRSITKRNGISRQDLVRSLKAQGVAFSDYQAFIGKSIERKSLIEKQITSNIKISDEEVVSYYSKNSKGNSGQVYEYKISHILFLPKNNDGTAALKRAKNVLEKVSKNPARYEKIARQYSEDPNFTEGGLLGSFKAGEMNSEIENGVKNLQPGKTSAIVKSRFGYHIFKLNKKTLVKDPELDKQRGLIKQKLFAKSFRKYFQNWLERKRVESYIRIN